MGEPAYRDIANAIRADIEARRLVEGDRLPTVRELAQRYGVPTGTVSKAVDVLRADGVLVARHGRGLYVRAFKRLLRSSPGRLSRTWWAGGKAIQDHDTADRLRSVDVTVQEAPASEGIAEALSVPAGAAVLTRARRFVVDDRIVMTATSHLPLDVVAAVPAVAYTGPGPGGIYARMAEAGLGPETFREALVCRMPTSAEAEALALPPGDAGHPDHPVRLHRHRALRRGQRDGAGLQRLRTGVRLRCLIIEAGRVAHLDDALLFELHGGLRTARYPRRPRREQADRVLDLGQGCQRCLCSRMVVPDGLVWMRTRSHRLLVRTSPKPR
ncbi:hypothetical protein Ade02nite_11360 [Paractinoplanes deccanensis]|uniref:HTH gntR-type domain-containing protein n=1 Tax=Paractinoplanes deccanensis TaxID=113561 RepID=A0ABQ3XXW4_9ACTN|nr:GntR family transcriptional regulator [Actinoplanes deccanensis]GID72495.1 hypothetical protein Ade02nite_11360 [Actinoplanes deccanensis]